MSVLNRGRVLIVEDEVLISMLLEDMLETIGLEVTATAASVADAEQAVQRGGFDLAILDIFVGGKETFGLADQLAAKGAPLIFATGGSRDNLPERFGNRPVLQKPYGVNNVAQAVRAAFSHGEA